MTDATLAATMAILNQRLGEVTKALKEIVSELRELREEKPSL